MSRPLKIVAGRTRQFQAADTLEVDVIDRLSGTGDLVIGGSLGAGEELILGSATSSVKILGDLDVDGSSIISVDETVTGTFTVEGNSSFGNNDGDIVNLGGGTSDVVNLNANLVLGLGVVSLGSGVLDYSSGIWVQAVNDNGPDLAGYDLRASGTNAGAYSIGVDPSLLTNATATDLMTVLDQLDTAIGSGGNPTGTNNPDFEINNAAVAGTDSDACLVLSGGDGGTSLIQTSLCQDSTLDTAYITITDNATQISPTFAIGDVTGASETGLSPTLSFIGTNTAPVNVEGSLNFQVNGADTHGDFLFGGAGLTTDSFVGVGTDNTVDLGSSGANRFADAYFGGTVNATDLVVGNTTVNSTSIINSAGALSVDLNVAGDGVLSLSNSNGGATGADIDFTEAGSAIRRTGDALSEILVSNLLDKSASETITGAYTFQTNDPILDQTALRITERATDPSNIANNGFVYTKDVTGVTELFYEDSDANVIQLTANGLINAATTLQSAYESGNTIAVTAAEGPLQVTNNTTGDATTVLDLVKNPAAAAAGTGFSMVMGANTTGTALFVSNAGTGNLLQAQKSGTDVILAGASGNVVLTPALNQPFSVTTTGTGTLSMASADSISATSSGSSVTLSGAAASSFTTSAGNLSLDSAAGELVLDDVGSAGLTLSQAGDRSLIQTGSGEILEGATSLVGAINNLAQSIDVNGNIVVELPIENGVTIALGDCVSASTVSGRCSQADANNSNIIAFLGIAVVGGTGDAGGTVSARIVISGLVTDSGASFTPQDALYLPDGTGRPTATAPTDIGDYNLRLGYAISATQYILHPSEGIQL